MEGWFQPPSRISPWPHPKFKFMFITRAFRRKRSRYKLAFVFFFFFRVQSQIAVELTAHASWLGTRRMNHNSTWSSEAWWLLISFGGKSCFTYKRHYFRITKDRLRRMSQALFCENPSYYFSKLPTNFKAVKNIFAVTAPSVAKSDCQDSSHITHKPCSPKRKPVRCCCCYSKTIKKSYKEGYCVSLEDFQGILKGLKEAFMSRCPWQCDVE